MAKWHELNEKLIRSAQLKMVRRSLSAAPVHNLFFLLLAYFVPELRSQGPAVWILGGAILLTTTGRIVLWKFSERVFARDNGAKLWRMIFGGCSVGLGIAWGLLQAMTFSHYHEHSESFLAMSICMGILTASIPTYSFDVLVNILFQNAIMWPAIAVLFVSGSPALAAVGFMLAVGVVFTSGVAVSLHRSQVELLVNQEIIEKQKNSLEQAHDELSRNHGLIRTMLESIEEAFLILDLDGVCVNEASSKAKEFFGLDPKGLTLPAVLQLDEEARKKCESWFFILKSDRFDFKETAGRGPKFFVNAKLKTTVALQYQAIRGAGGELQSLVMTAVDVTRELEAQKAEKEAQEKSELILRVNENKNGFREFLEHFERSVEGLAGIAHKSLSEARQQLHTLKGTSALFGAKSLSHEVHGVELEIRRSEAKAGEAVPLKTVPLNTATVPSAEVDTQVHRLKAIFARWKQKEMPLFVQLGIFDEEKVEFSKRRLSEMESQFSAEHLRSFQQILQKLTESEFGEHIKDFAFHVSRVAAKLEKQVTLQVRRESQQLFLAPEAYREVLRSLVHLFNNAIDHGIEKPDERLAQGKPQVGTIAVTYGVSKDDRGKEWIKLLIQDDGRGIDVAKLRERARAKGQALDAKSDLEVMHSIFEEGITTRDAVTEVSGQGVGMGALRMAVLKVRGRIKIVKSDLQGTTFEIILPVLQASKNDSASSTPAAS